MEEKFPTEKEITEEIERQFKGFLVQVENLRSGEGSIGADFDNDGGFQGSLYRGKYWSGTIMVWAPRGHLLFRYQLYFCTPAQYHAACRKYKKQHYLDSYPLDTLTYLASRCEALPDGRKATVLLLPRTLANYVFGWGRQGKPYTSDVRVRNLHVADRKRKILSVLNRLREGVDRNLKVGGTVVLRHNLYRKKMADGTTYHWPQCYAKRGLRGKVVAMFTEKTYPCVEVLGDNGKKYTFRESSLDKV